MKITRVRIENFRGHKNTELDFADHHVLVGENGSGKTAVLEAINYATSSFYLSSRLDEQDFNNADTDPIRITVEFDKPFVVKIPDGYTHQMLLAKSVELNAKRREKAAPGRAFSDPFVVSHLCHPITYQEKSEINAISLPDALLAQLLNEPAQQAECYRRILQFNPHHVEARARLQALSWHSDIDSEAAIASGTQSIDQLLEEVMYADEVKAERLPTLVRDGLAHDDLEDYVLRELAQYASHTTLARYICDTHGASWPQAEEFVSWVARKHNHEIVKRHLPLIATLGVATMLVGVLIMWHSFNLGTAINQACAECYGASFSLDMIIMCYICIITFVMPDISGYGFTIGLAMFLGGLTGTIYQMNKVRDAAS